MKLKKIASLALAGVMAISMLAGCGDNSSNNGNTDGKDEGTTTVSSISTTLYNELSKDVRLSVVKAVADSKLDAALKSAVDDYITDENVKAQYDTSINSTPTIQKDVADALDAENGFTSAKLEESDKDKTVVLAYYVGGGVSDTLALEKVAEKLNTDLKNELPAVSKDKDYEYDYSIAASVVIRSYTEKGSELNMKYVAVAITQMVTEV